MVINIDSTEQSRARLQLRSTPGARAPPRPTPKGGFASPDPLGLAPPRPTPRSLAPPRPTPEGGLRLARPLGACPHLSRHQGRGLRLA